MRFILFATIAALPLAACDAGPSADSIDAAEPGGTYTVDAENGETRAQHTAEDGTVTTLQAGEDMPVQLPEGFTLFPGAEVLSNTRVERNGGEIVVLSMQSDASAEEIVAFYRRQAEAADIAIDLEMESGPMTMFGGRAEDGTQMSMTVTRDGAEGASAQLTVERGL